jgi:hypothetical protein
MRRKSIIFLGILAVTAGIAMHAVGKDQSPTSAKRLRTEIKIPDGCTYTTVEDRPVYPSENACAEAFANFTDWPPVGWGEEFECDRDYAHAVSHGTVEGENDGLKFLPLAPGKFLVELDCGAGAYNYRNAYLFYDETVTPPTLKRLRFPYYRFDRLPGDEDNTEKAVPQKTWVSVVSSRAFNRPRKELIVLSKCRGLGDCGTFARYVFHDGEPVLKEFRFKLEWDGRHRYYVSGPNAPSPKGWRSVPVK